MSQANKLTRVIPGMEIVFGGDRVLRVPAEVAECFAPGDALVVVEAAGDLLHIPAAERALAAAMSCSLTAAISAQISSASSRAANSA